MTPQTLVEQHLSDVLSLARSTYRRHPYADLDDLIGDGLVGLWQAAQRFDSEVGCDFMPYARHRIVGEMISGLRSRFGRGPRAQLVSLDERSLLPLADPNPTVCALVVGLPDRLRRVLTLLAAGHTHAEVAQIMGLSRGRVSQLVAAARVASKEGATCPLPT